jgi:hypothetical protein
MTHETPTDGQTPGEPPSPEARALYLRWRAALPSQPPADIEPLTLAAWIDRGMTDAHGDEIERTIAVDPTLLDELAALSLPLSPEAASPAFLARAQSLIAADGEAHSAAVLPFDRGRQRQRAAAGPVRRQPPSWFSIGALAASLAIVSMAGFGVGITLGQQIAPTTLQHPGNGAATPEPGTFDDGIG